MTIQLDKLPMKLQFFAEPSGDPEPTPTPADPKGSGNEEKDPAPKPEGDTDEGADKKYTDEDVDNIIKSKFAKWKKEQEDKAAENKKYEDMTKAERAEYDRNKEAERAKKAEDELNKYKLRDSVRSEAAKNSLSLTDDDLDHLVTGDAESTNKNVEWFKGAAERFETKFKEELRKGNPPLSGNGQKAKGSLGERLAGNGTPTKDPFFN